MHEMSQWRQTIARRLASIALGAHPRYGVEPLQCYHLYLRDKM